MVELENTLVPKLEQHVQNSRRYVDDTFVYMKNGSIKYVLSALETFHPNTKFTYEKEVNDTFLDILLIRNSDYVHTTVYRKETKNDLYLHWYVYSPIFWKRGTIKTLVNRAYIICSNNNYLQQKVKHLERVFHIQNDYRMWIIRQIIKDVKENKRTLLSTQIDAPLKTLSMTEKYTPLCVSPAGATGNTMLKSINRCIKRIVPNDVNTQITYTGHKIKMKLPKFINMICKHRQNIREKV